MADGWRRCTRGWPGWDEEGGGGGGREEEEGGGARGLHDLRHRAMHLEANMEQATVCYMVQGAWCRVLH